MLTRVTETYTSETRYVELEWHLAWVYSVIVAQFGERRLIIESSIMRQMYHM